MLDIQNKNSLNSFSLEFGAASEDLEVNHYIVIWDDLGLRHHSLHVRFKSVRGTMSTATRVIWNINSMHRNKYSSMVNDQPKHCRKYIVVSSVVVWNTIRSGFINVVVCFSDLGQSYSFQWLQHILTSTSKLNFSHLVNSWQDSEANNLWFYRVFEYTNKFHVNFLFLIKQN